MSVATGTTRALGADSEVGKRRRVRVHRPDLAAVSERSFLDEVTDVLGITDLRPVTTGGDEFEAERNQWDDGNDV